MIEIRIDDGGLREILDRGSNLTEALGIALEERLRDPWRDRIAERAQEMVPVQFGILAGSQQAENIDGGFAVTYGGLASGYAARQHEDEGLQHNPPTNKFSYEGPFGGDQPGAWNAIGGLRGAEGALFGKAIEWDSAKSSWRFLHVQYGSGRRSLRTDHPIKAEATAHWLFGAPFSAYESNESAMVDDLTKFGAAYAEQYLHAQQ